MIDAARRRRRLRELLAAPGLSIAPGATSPFSARQVEQAGFSLVFTTGAGIANTMLGLPDLGLTTLTEIAFANRQIANAVAIPVLADADTGYGETLNVVRTVRDLESAGVAGVIIEDQVAPKKCGHFEGQEVVRPEEMVQKIVAARLARTDQDLVLVARTDAIASEGVDAAIARAVMYAEAGADAVFLEAPVSIEQMAKIPGSVPVPCIVNLVEGGKTPLLAADELLSMGYRIAIYANLALRVGARAVERAFETLHRTGTSEGLIDELMPWSDRQRLAGLDDWQALDARIAQEAANVLESIRANERLGDESYGD